MFTRNEYKAEIIKSWLHCQQKKGLEIYAWCIMPGHIHRIVSSHNKQLDDIVGDMKSHTSSLLKKLIKEYPKESRREWIVWMACPDFHRNARGQAKRTAIIPVGNFGSSITSQLKY